MYDPVSSSAILEANQGSFRAGGNSVLPLRQSRVIVSFDADFLGTWISQVEFAAPVRQSRKIDNVKNPKMSVIFGWKAT